MLDKAITSSTHRDPLVQFLDEFIEPAEISAELKAWVRNHVNGEKGPWSEAGLVRSIDFSSLDKIVITTEFGEAYLYPPKKEVPPQKSPIAVESTSFNSPSIVPGFREADFLWNYAQRAFAVRSSSLPLIPDDWKLLGSLFTGSLPFERADSKWGQKLRGYIVLENDPLTNVLKVNNTEVEEIFHRPRFSQLFTEIMGGSPFGISMVRLQAMHTGDFMVIHRDRIRHVRDQFTVCMYPDCGSYEGGNLLHHKAGKAKTDSYPTAPNSISCVTMYEEHGVDSITSSAIGPDKSHTGFRAAVIVRLYRK